MSPRGSKMQRQMGQTGDELVKLQERLSAVEKERDQAIRELHEMKKAGEQAEMKLSETMSPRNSRKVADIDTELNKMKGALASTSQELKTKEMKIESLKAELEKAKEWKVKLEDKDASWNKMKQDLLSESKKRIQELEDEVERGKESETRLFDSFVVRMKQLEQTKILLEESQLENESLRRKLEKSCGGKGSSSLRESESGFEGHISMKEELESLKSELQWAKQNLVHAQEAEKLSSLKLKDLLEEMNVLKDELKLATKAEENNKKAMDDLALALKEVATDCNQAREKLATTQAELQLATGEVEQLQASLRSTEENYKTLLQEARKEADQYKNTAERLRFEAEETLLAWNGKEAGFVGCIRRAEEEKNFALEENNRLLQALVTAENLSKKAKEENLKVRDILKQAINEANVAKEAAGIARAENSQLKDTLAEKEDAVKFLTIENENLKINEAAAFENIKELKRLLSEASANEVKTEDKEQVVNLSSQNSVDKEHKDEMKLGKTCSFNLKELKIPHKSKDAEEDPKAPNQHDDEDGESPNEDLFKGSIFDEMAESPVTTTQHSRKPSCGSIDDVEALNSEDFDHLDGTHFDDSESDRSSRKKKALLRRFGDLIRKRSFHRKEPSLE